MSIELNMKIVTDNKEIVDENQKESIAREILNDLPEWFDIPEIRGKYIIVS
ncbi:hypothetical protein [Leptotrichia sp. OH3620_COT-345]|uniref:hypothetical protein n=1 Tax=Leptotrichia sp. OH3620_COT-345 TaxID=2491048 RepID=UPI0018F6ACBD|nr:hypothetical protein [Leptotrichia sp. OH3620_COT-345]